MDILLDAPLKRKRFADCDVQENRRPSLVSCLARQEASRTDTCFGAQLRYTRASDQARRTNRGFIGLESGLFLIAPSAHSRARRVQHEKAERDLVRATQASEKALKSQSAARGRVQDAKSARAEAEALAKKTLKSAR